MNLAGVEIILNMRRRIQQMQVEVNEFMAYVKKELARGIDDWEQRLSTALVKSTPTDLVRTAPPPPPPAPRAERPPHPSLPRPPRDADPESVAATATQPTRRHAEPLRERRQPKLRQRRVPDRDIVQFHESSRHLPQFRHDSCIRHPW